MSESIHVVGFIPPDETWKRMKAVWDTCEAAGIPVPREVEIFFNNEVPDEAGVSVELKVREWGDDSRDGFELDVDAIPEHVKRIRLYRSW